VALSTFAESESMEKDAQITYLRGAFYKGMAEVTLGLQV
jgi:hypothetical protein